ncbi:DUF4199 domain-containing protein [Shivajiella indica]|uniref:DUF4199 domain-containing protein n=1 Tax=Shivajiella indica TaxID=872115 RepID=A0ABW5B9Y9_9BACT
MENQNTPIKAGLNAGLILGILSVVITFIVYFVSPSTLVSGIFGIAMLVVFFGLLIYFGIQYRTSLGGFMEFGKAFQYSFIALLVAGIISQIGNALLYNLIDPALPGVLAEQTIENTMEMMEKFGAADSISSEQLDKMRQDAEANYTFSGQLKALGIASIIYAIIALIIGAIIKKRDKSLDF